MFDTLRNTAQPAFQTGRSAATAPLTSTAVANPGSALPGPGGAPALTGVAPQGSVAPGGPQPAFAMQTMPWSQGGNPFMQMALLQNAQGGATQSALGSAVGAFADGRGSTGMSAAPLVRFGGK